MYRNIRQNAARITPMILVIDNYDSFTYNIVQYLGELGADVKVYRNDALTVAKIADLKPERILISPGPGVPANAGIAVEAIREFVGEDADTRRLSRPSGDRRGVRRACRPRKDIDAREDIGNLSRLAHHFRGLPYRFKATRYHSLVVDKETVPESLEISATTPDGVIMGLRHREFPVEGVQFHPESVMTEHGKMIY